MGGGRDSTTHESSARRSRALRKLDEVYNKETEEKVIAGIIIARQRNGPIGHFQIVVRNDITKFLNYEPQPDFSALAASRGAHRRPR